MITVFGWLTLLIFSIHAVMTLQASNGRCWPFKKRSWKLRRFGDPVWPEFLWKSGSENHFFSSRFTYWIHLLFLFWLVNFYSSGYAKKTFVQIFQRWRNISLFSGIARIGVINDTGLLGLQAELCQEGQMAYSIVTYSDVMREMVISTEKGRCLQTYIWLMTHIGIDVTVQLSK